MNLKLLHFNFNEDHLPIDYETVIKGNFKVACY